jgi:GLPGLI family protein
MKFGRLFFLTFFLLVFTFNSYSQIVITRQTMDRISGNLPKEQLDTGVYRSIYHFSQQITNSETGHIFFQTDSMALDFGRNFSVYYDWNKARRDSIGRAKTGGMDITVFHMKTDPEYDMVEYKETQGEYFVNSPKGENSEIYKNRLKNEVISVDVTDLEAFKCVEQLNPQDWQFTTDTLTVLGYPCQKATASFRGREYEAWFSPEIPIKEGPWKLFGLPGLILKVVVDNGLFSFEAIGLENLEEVYISMDKDSYANCTRQQFAKYKSDKRKKLLARHYSEGTLTVGNTKNPFEYNDL